MIFFRSDASDIIGTGHVVRCLTLAKGLRKFGKKCQFICRDHDGNLIHKIKQDGFDVRVISNNKKLTFKNDKDDSMPFHANWLGASWEDDAEETMKLIHKDEVDLIVVDHYSIDNRWEEKLRLNSKKIMVIDDLADRSHDCDILLDQNLIKNYESRYDNLIPIKCTTLLGPKYALLQDEYQRLHKHSKPRIRNIKRILIFFGGSDQNNLTGLTLSIFLKLNRPDIKLDIVLDSKSKYKNEIQAMIKQHSNIAMYSNLPSIAYLMHKADLSIGAGGSTTWERCCLGLPAILIVTGLNQEKIAASMKSNGAALILKLNIDLEKNILEALRYVLEDKDLHYQMSKKAFSICDGKGINRVIKKII